MISKIYLQRRISILRQNFLSSGSIRSFHSLQGNKFVQKPWDLLLRQLKSMGGELNKLTISEVYPGVSGMVATEDIDANDLLHYIPEQFIVD